MAKSSVTIRAAWIGAGATILAAIIMLKRRGTKHVENLIAGMSLPEQLEFWRKRTEAMLRRQKKSLQK